MDNLKEATLQSELRFKDLIINPCHRSVLINNNRIDLTTKEFDLLYFLAIHPGWAFTKSQIYETVWGEEYVVRLVGFEPTRLSAPPPQDGVSAVPPQPLI